MVIVYRNEVKAQRPRQRPLARDSEREEPQGKCMVIRGDVHPTLLYRAR